MKKKQPYYPDHCEHLKCACGVFVGSTVSPNGDPIDVYIWGGDSCTGYRHRELCVRYGESGEQYFSPFSTPEEWSNPKRVVQDVNGKMMLASCFDGPAMELVRAFLAKETRK